MFRLVVLLVAICSSSSAEEGTALGEAFYVPKADLVGSIPSGVKIFKDLPDNCVEERQIGKITRNEHFYKDTSSFYKSISTSTQLDASYQSNFAMGATLDATTKHISSNEREVSGTSLKLHSKSFKRILQKNCLLEATFMDGFQSDFEALETAVDEPWHKESWRKYDTFMQKYGSHVISGIVYGSSVEQYVFAQSNKAYSQHDFAVKACAELAGPAGAGKVDVKACAGVDSSQIEKTSSMDTSKSAVVTGGKPDTRSKMEREDRSPELIEQFLTEGTSDPGPIQVLLTPVWKIMQDFYSSKNDEMVEKAKNMEYYFQGYLNYGCDYKKDGNIELQKFTKSEDSRPGRPKFICSIAPEGCHDDDDCHYKPIWCSCNGDSCVHYSKKKENNGKERTEVTINKDEPWGWHGCDWKVAGSVCACYNKNKERVTVWSSSSLRDAVSDKNKLKDHIKKYKPQKNSESSEEDHNE